MKTVQILIGIIFCWITSAAQQVNVDSLINDYLALKNAMTIDNGDSAQSSARLLFHDLKEFNPENLSKTQRKVWNQYSEKLSYDAEHLKETSELEHQRKHFVSLSNNFFKLLKGLSLNSMVLYYQFCPMADDGKGAYWLSETSEIINPYMGKRMPKCGSNKDSLKVK